MKKSLLLLTIMALCMTFAPESLWAAVTGDAPVKGNEPLLITNAGQGPGGKMGRLLVRRSKAVKTMKYNAEPTIEDIKNGGYKTILVVVGSSAKGLGASGITIDDEVARLVKVMEGCKEAGVQVIVAHIEGKARRGKAGSANERSIDAVAPYAQAFIVKSDSDLDGRFTKLAEANNAPLTVIDETLDFMTVVKEMYSK